VLQAGLLTWPPRNESHFVSTMATLPSRAERNGDLSEVRRHQIMRSWAGLTVAVTVRAFHPLPYSPVGHNGHLKAIEKNEAGR
jgi:hypothetical protein